MARQRLFHNGKQLEDAHQLSHYDCVDGAEIVLVCGGGHVSGDDARGTGDAGRGGRRGADGHGARLVLPSRAAATAKQSHSMHPA